MPTLLTWDQVPPEVRSAVEPHLERWRHLIPPYYREVRVVYDTDDDESALWTNARPEYRIATMGVAPKFLEVSDLHRRGVCVAHELIHMAVEPMRDCFFELMKAAVGTDPSPLREWADQQWEAQMEAAVCDLAEAIAGSEG